MYEDTEHLFIYLYIYFLLATLVTCTRCRKKHYQIRREEQLEAAVVVSFLTIWISNFALLQKRKKLPYLLKSGTYMYLNQIPQKGRFCGNYVLD